MKLTKPGELRSFAAYPRCWADLGVNGRWSVTTELKDLWTPAGVILGFQMTSFAWRLAEEAKVRNEGDIPWLVPADYLNLAGMLILVFGVFVGPIFPAAAMLPWSKQAVVLFGLGTLLFVGHVFAMAGHYQLFNKTRRGSGMKLTWCPRQEAVTVWCTFGLSALYLILAAISES
jgi:hypothetical protein